YTLDWDGNNGRTGRIDVLDAANDAVLDTRDLSAYSSGKYFVWQMRGHVKIRLTNLAGWNQVISGLFFDPPNGNQPPVANAGGPYSGMTGTPIQFNGSSSYDPDGSIVSYSWNFGDGGTASG